MRKGYWIALTFIALAAAGYLSLFHLLGLREKISTSVLDLIPSSQGDWHANVARTLMQSGQSRVLLIAVSADGGQAVSVEQRAAFLAALQDSAAFSEVYDVASEAYLKATAGVFFSHRIPLLFPSYLENQYALFAKNQSTDAAAQNTNPAATTLQNSVTAATPANTAAPQYAINSAMAVTTAADFPSWLAKHAASDLDRFLDTPEAMAYQTLIPQDPLLLVMRTFELWRKANSGFSRKPDPAHLLVWAKLAASPLTPEGQQPVFDALQTALDAANALAAATDAGQSNLLIGTEANNRTKTSASSPPPDNALQSDNAAMQPRLTMQTAGVGSFAAASERGIRNEVAFFNIASVAAVLLLCFLLLRSPSVLFHTVALLSLSLPFAWLVTLLLFNSVPIISLVVGSILVGVTIDYCLHVFLEHKGDEGSVLKPLLLSCGTTTAAFLALLLSPLPLLRQTGAFVAVGLVATCALALLYRRLFGHYIRASVRDSIRIRRPLRWKLPALCLLALLATGIWHIRWDDSIANLQYPLPQLEAQDAAVRAQFDADRQYIYLSAGTDYADARQSLANFTRCAGAETALTGIADWIPTFDAYAAALSFLKDNPQFPQQLSDALEQNGYDVAAFAPFFDALANWRDGDAGRGSYNAMVEALQTELPGPVGTALGGNSNTHFFVSLSAQPVDAGKLTAGTVRLDPRHAFSEAFASYRHNALGLSGYGLAAIIIGSLAVYGLRRGAKVLLVPLAAGLAAIGTIGYLNAELNLFHVIGMFLGVCLALDYGAFLMRDAEAPSVPYSVCVAAATTLCTFLLLTLSRIPAVTALGSTVALCIAYAFALVVLLTTPRRSKATPDTQTATESKAGKGTAR